VGFMSFHRGGDPAPDPPGPAARGDPSMVGPYRLLQRLGEGGMGVVHLALDPHGQAVALKVLRAHVSMDPQARQRLSREVATLRRIRHPQVAEVLDADVDGDPPYLVTRFVPGLPLDAHVARYGPFTRPQVAQLGRSLAAALGAIHAAGVVHRDVKPANVMLVDGEPMLIDFGIAHLADESRITVPGQVMGTPGYLSPEVVGGAELTPASDWWGWGATLAYAATGRPPFGTGAVEVVLDRVRRGQHDLDGLDRPMRAALAAALCTDPARRPDPAALLAGLDGAPGPPRPASGTEVVRMPPTRQDLPPGAGQPPAAGPSRAGPAATAATPPPGQRTASPRPAAPPVRAAAGPAATPQPPGTPAGRAPGNPYAAPAPVRAARMAPYPAAGAPAPAAGNGRPPTAPGATPATGPVTAAGAEGGGGGFRAAVLLAGLVALSATAVVAPGGAVLLAAAAMALARTVDTSVTGFVRRRVEYGPRGSDVAVTILALPYRVLLAALATGFGLILPLIAGISAAFTVGLLDLRQGTPSPGSAPALAGGMATLLVVAWWGPGGGSVRRGSRVIIRRAGRNRVGALVLLGVLVLLTVSALSAASDGGGPDYWPAPRPSIGGLLSWQPLFG